MKTDSRCSAKAVTTFTLSVVFIAGLLMFFAVGIRSDALYVNANYKNGIITVIPADLQSITENVISSELNSEIHIADGESVKNGVKLNIGNSEYTLVIKADVSPDGRITAADARGILRIAARLDYADEIILLAADINSDGTVTVSEARDTLRFVSRLSDKLAEAKIREDESESVSSIEETTEKDNEQTSFAYEEKKKIIWVALGDSKTDFDNNGVSRPDNYPYWIVKRNPQLELVNMGSAGGMITNERVKKSGDTKILYPSMYSKAVQINVKPDIITVAGGFNDWNWCLPLGEFTTDISSFDVSTDADVSSIDTVFPLKNTFYAGVYRLAEYLKTTYPDTPILWITPCPTAVNDYGGANGHDVNLPLSAYVRAIREVCAYFSIPVCDMSEETSVPYFTKEDLNGYWRNGDGVHPNGKASEIYSFKIEVYMKKTYESYGYTWIES